MQKPFTQRSETLRLNKNNRLSAPTDEAKLVITPSDEQGQLLLDSWGHPVGNTHAITMLWADQNLPEQSEPFYGVMFTFTDQAFSTEIFRARRGRLNSLTRATRSSRPLSHWVATNNPHQYTHGLEVYATISDRDMTVRRLRKLSFIEDIGIVEVKLMVRSLRQIQAA
jgi:hypothetical protein